MSRDFKVISLHQRKMSVTECLFIESGCQILYAIYEKDVGQWYLWVDFGTCNTSCYFYNHKNQLILSTSTLHLNNILCYIYILVITLLTLLVSTRS